MARVAGVNIPDNKHIWVALTYIKGIGKTRSMRVLESAKVKADAKVKDLSEAELESVRTAIKVYEDELEGNLRRKVAQAIDRLKYIGCYRGIRHRTGQPVRGQKNRNKPSNRRRTG